MASFVHIADQKNAKAIRRSGILAQRIDGGCRAVFCVPVTSDFNSTHHWVRELRRRGYQASCAAQFRISDDELVRVGRYGRHHSVMSAAEAVALFRGGSDVRGFEVLVGRNIGAREIRRMKSLPHLVGWRFFPEAKGSMPFWPARGEIKARRLRDGINSRFA